jgi:hypothetical protein
MTKEEYEKQLSELIGSESEALVAKYFELKGFSIVNREELEYKYRQHSDMVFDAPYDITHRWVIQVQGSAGLFSTRNFMTIPYEKRKKLEESYEIYKGIILSGVSSERHLCAFVNWFDYESPVKFVWFDIFVTPFQFKNENKNPKIQGFRFNWKNPNLKAFQDHERMKLNDIKHEEFHQAFIAGVEAIQGFKNQANPTSDMFANDDPFNFGI